MTHSLSIDRDTKEQGENREVSSIMSSMYEYSPYRRHTDDERQTSRQTNRQGFEHMTGYTSAINIRHYCSLYLNGRHVFSLGDLVYQQPAIYLDRNLGPQRTA